LVLQTFAETEVLRNTRASREYDAHEIDQLISKDSDGLFFLDYLRAIRNEDSDERYLKFLGTHRQVIEDKLTGLERLNIAAKLGWLASYHNRIVASAVADPGTRSQLTIELHKRGPFFDLPRSLPTSEGLEP
jgi:hypothetical protein